MKFANYIGRLSFVVMPDFRYAGDENLVQQVLRIIHNPLAYTPYGGLGRPLMSFFASLHLMIRIRIILQVGGPAPQRLFYRVRPTRLANQVSP
jgi:hypothetical protein